jgi:competence protein ComGC
MRKILKGLSFYIFTIIFVVLVALSMPSAMKCTRQIEDTHSKTILEVVRHKDTTYSVTLQDNVYDALNEDELDSILLELLILQN